MKRKFVYIAFILILITLSPVKAVEPDSPDDVVLVNTGLMNIHTGGTNGVAMYVPFAMRHAGSNVSVILNGAINVGGNFYQDASTAVFKTDEATSTSAAYSNGIFRFVKNWNQPREINSNLIASTYDRGVSYIAFPNVRIATNDTFKISAKMGMDALTLKRDPGYTGKMVLKSDRYADQVYDASLRVTGQGKSEDLVDAGSVIIEREMSYYRSLSGIDKLFGFATPFNKTQLSGYFAGNWVRRPVAEPVTGHTHYVFGNEQDENGTILASQYIYHPLEKLQPAQAYLIRPRPEGFRYADLQAQNGLSVTNGDTTAYDQSKFVFNGKVYTLASYNEQLFAQDTLFHSPSVTSTSTTINWLIGNSYTSPIGTNQLIDAMSASPLKFSPYIWVYPAGSSTYQSYKITGTDNIVVQDLQEIPAMSVFMIRVLNGTNPGQFNITKEMQRHAKVTHSTVQKVKRAVSENINNQVRFRVSPTDNNLVYDVAAIGLRASAQSGSDSYDMTKVYSEADVFQLYSLSSVDAKLSANGVPLNTEQVRLCFRPVSRPTEFRLEAEDVESLSSQGLWLEDKKTGKIIDMMVNGSYIFTGSAGDAEERFIIHFVAPGNTGLGEGDISGSGIYVYVENQSLMINNLTTNDLGSKILLFDALGRLISMHVANACPVMVIPFNYASGMYVMKMNGDRNASAKFTNKKL
ncbi:MAG: hypothetical protein VB102_01115 [Paludibacter sp.]|nr:hypothetical protein [Paludibacter sp.]